MNKNEFNNIRARLIKETGGKLNDRDIEKLKSGNLSSVKNLLSKEEKQMLLSLLKDKSAAKKILDSPQVRDILNRKK